MKAKGPQGLTPLHWTVIADMDRTHENLRVAYLELAENLPAGGADINAEDEFGNTPLDWQEVSSNADLIELLLESGVRHGYYSSETVRMRTLMDQVRAAAAAAAISPQSGNWCALTSRPGRNCNSAGKLTTSCARKYSFCALRAIMTIPRTRVPGATTSRPLTHHRRRHHPRSASRRRIAWGEIQPRGALRPRYLRTCSWGLGAVLFERTFELHSNMATASPIQSQVAVRRRSSVSGPRLESRFDRRLARILVHASNVFCDKGYAAASMRDLSRASGVSLSGLYYYFKSKEELLYLIQKHAFNTIVDRLRQRLDGIEDPADRICEFILNHLEYFLANQKAMKVLSHEDDVLKNGFGSEIAALKREYYRICVELLDNYKRSRGLEFSSRTAVLSLFGMMNWIYTWYNPKVDGGAEELAKEMGNIFLQGIGVTASRASQSQRKKPAISG